MKKRFFWGVLVVVMIAVGFGIQNKQQTASSSKPLLKIGIPVYPGYAPFILAEKKGFFAKEGVNAKVIQLQDTNQVVSALGSNQVQLLAATADFAPILRDAQVKATEIFSTDQSNGADGILTKKGIDSVADLKGKKIYVAQGFPDDYILQSILKKAGIKMSEVEIVNMDPDQIGAAFVGEKIDVGVTWEPWLSKAAERADGQVLTTTKENPGISIDTVFVRDDILKSQRAQIEGVARAYFDAIEYWKSHTSESNQIMAEALGLKVEDFSVQIQKIKFSDLATNLQLFQSSNSTSVEFHSKEAAEMYKQEGIIKGTSNDSYSTDSILKSMAK